MVILLPLLLLLLLILQHQIGGGAALPLLLGAAVAFLSFSLLSLSRFVPFLSALLQLFPIAAAVCLFLAVPLLLLHLHLFLVSERAGAAGCRCIFVCVCHVYALSQASVRDCSDSLFVWFHSSILSTSTLYSYLYTCTLSFNAI